MADSDCVLAVALLSCCSVRGGGEPPCPVAAARARVGRDPCLAAFTAGAPAPEPSVACQPYCAGVVCPACAPREGAVCRAGRCVALSPSGCAEDADCPPGTACADPDGDGLSACVPGEHQCGRDQDCLAARPECDECRCEAFGREGRRTCQCWGCPGEECASSLGCEPGHFCVEGRCVPGGPGACRPGAGQLDCPQGLQCEDQGGGRGRCVEPREGLTDEPEG